MPKKANVDVSLKTLSSGICKVVLVSVDLRESFQMSLTLLQSGSMKKRFHLEENGQYVIYGSHAESLLCS